VNVGLLACDEVAERFQHVAGGYQQMFERLLSRHIPGLRITRFDMQAGQVPASATECDAWITTGSRASVYDDAAWIRTAVSFVNKIADADRPFAGICFGHQLLARALGAEVKRAPGGWGVAVLPMRVLRDEAWMTPACSTVRLQYMHADQVTAAPEGATVLGEAPHCPVAMFQCGRRLLGIQGHPEFTAAYARALIVDRRARIGEAAADDALARVDAPMDAEVVGAWIARFFAGQPS
jgi:GMP synthase-like glutamine amidotransferase